MVDAIQQLIEPHIQDLGGFQARRLLPLDTLTMVGPFIFFDHLGPAVFPPGKGVDVRPHPHINLATVTYLLEFRLKKRERQQKSNLSHRWGENEGEKEHPSTP